jgi:hypothetical protein
MFMSELDVSRFFQKLEEDSVADYGDKDQVTKIYMNNPGDQGTIIIIPFLNKKDNGAYYQLSNVREWLTPSSRYPKYDKVAYKVLPEGEYGVLSKENSELLAEVNGLLDLIKDSGAVSFDKIRLRRYTFIYGVLTSHRGVDGNLILKNVNKPCLFVFPSQKPVTALNLAAQAKQDLIQGTSNLWVTDIINSNVTNRRGVLSINFRSSAKGKGYDSAVTFELDSLKAPGMSFEEDILKYFADPVRDWLGWQGVENSAEYFNPVVMSELRDILSLEYKRIQDRKGIGERPKEPRSVVSVVKEVEGVNASAVGKPAVSEVLSDLPF